MRSWLNEFVRGRRARPVVHENGFIQLPLTEYIRLHVWPDGVITRQKTHNPIHDHRFSFESSVLLGTLRHITYGWIEDAAGPMEVFSVLGGKLVPTSRFGQADVTSAYMIPAGTSYFFAKGQLHESQGIGLTATLMEKVETSALTARVLCPRGEPPDNTFDRWQENDEALLWQYIDRAVLA